MSVTACFREDVSGSPTSENERYRSFLGVGSPWPALPPTPLENERNGSFSGGCIEHAHMGVFYVSSVSSLHLSNAKDTPERACLWLRTLPFHPAPPSTSRTPETRPNGRVFGVPLSPSLLLSPLSPPLTHLSLPSLSPLFPPSFPFSSLVFSLYILGVFYVSYFLLLGSFHFCTYLYTILLWICIII